MAAPQTKHELGAAVPEHTLGYIAQARGLSKLSLADPNEAQVTATFSSARPEDQPTPGKSGQGSAPYLLLTNSRAQPNFL